MSSSLSLSGSVKVRKVSPPGPGFWWHFRNRTRFSFWFGWLANTLAYWFSRLTGVVTLTSELRIFMRHNDGSMVDYGVVGYRMVTTAGVTFMASDFAGNDGLLNTMNFHGIGTGGTAESVANTALVTNATPGGNFIAGEKSNPSATMYQTQATITFPAAVSIAEHGLFNQANPTGAKLWDRTVFAPVIPAGVNDNITFQYQLTINAGG